MSEGRYAGKVVLVTGAASGIGRGVAERLAREGATLALGDIRAEPLEACAAALAAEHGVEVTPVQYDAADAESCRALVDKSVAAHGRLDCLMNIAGILDWGHFTDLDDARWERLWQVNVSGVVHVTRQAIPHLLATRGNIVNTSSTSGLTGHAYYVAYGMTKGAMIHFTKALAVEYIEQGLRVNVVAPGAIESAITEGLPHPDGINEKLWHRIFPKTERSGRPSDIASAYAYLGSDEADFVTGAVLAVDNGITAG